MTAIEQKETIVVEHTNLHVKLTRVEKAKRRRPQHTRTNTTPQEQMSDIFNTSTTHAQCVMQ